MKKKVFPKMLIQWIRGGEAATPNPICGWRFWGHSCPLTCLLHSSKLTHSHSLTHSCSLTCLLLTSDPLLLTRLSTHSLLPLTHSWHESCLSFLLTHNSLLPLTHSWPSLALSTLILNLRLSWNKMGFFFIDTTLIFFSLSQWRISSPMAVRPIEKPRIYSSA